MTAEKCIIKLLAKAGGATAIATSLGGSVKRQNVEYWVKSGEFPAEHCPALEKAYGLRCEALRPDLSWVRVADPEWPTTGKPLLDVAASVEHG